MVVLPGSNAKLPALLLLAHVDVVEADRKDWTDDPFVLREEDGFFYGRGVEDDKNMAAAFADTMVRLKEQKYKPKRTIKMALTCGEEGGSTNGVRYILEHDKSLLDAGLRAQRGRRRRPVRGSPPASASTSRSRSPRKCPPSYKLEVTNPGGHSSRPRPDNAIYQLSKALLKVSELDFPVMFDDVTRDYFQKMADITGGQEGDDMRAALKGDMAATKRLEADPLYNATLHTTCVATLLSGGHAANALPQRADATVNCRIFPGTPAEDVKKALETAIDDPEVKITGRSDVSGATTPATLPAEVMEPIQKLSAKMFPGVPVLPIMTPGATDGASLAAAGIPTYGVSGMFTEPLYNAHGLNERIAVKSLYDGREFLYRLTKLYTGGK